MREIKFRAVSKLKREPTFLFTLEDVMRGKVTVSYFEHWHINQYTGLHDKNGKEIYEGDVIEMEEPVMESDMIRCAVVFDEGSFSARWDRQSQTTFFPLSQCGIEDENVEIIGNIYENPNLLTP